MPSRRLLRSLLCQFGGGDRSRRRFPPDNVIIRLTCKRPRGVPDPTELAAVDGVTLSGDARMAVAASEDKTLKVWDVGSGRELRTLEGHTDHIHGVALSGDGLLAVSVSRDSTVKVWEVASGVPIATFTCKTTAFCCAIVNDREAVAGDLIGRVYFLCLESKSKK